MESFERGVTVTGTVCSFPTHSPTLFCSRDPPTLSSNRFSSSQRVSFLKDFNLTPMCWPFALVFLVFIASLSNALAPMYLLPLVSASPLNP